MKKLFLVFSLALVAITVHAQPKYYTRNGKTSFDASGSEKILSINNQGSSVFDAKSGQFEFAVLMKGFEFEKALMQDHFHENYAESTKYPKAFFKGIASDISKIDFTKDGNYPIKVKGSITIHGVTKEIIADASILIKGGKVIGKSSFDVLLTDFNISIPPLVADKVAKIAKISVEANYDKM